MPRVRHIFLKLCASLTCGVILTLVSAWLPAVFFEIKTGKLHNLEHEPPLEIPAYIDAPKDWHLRTWHACWGPGLRYDLVSECEWMGSKLGWSSTTAPNRTMLRMTTGFPLPCMRWTPFAAGDLPESGSHNPWHIGLDLPGKQVINPGVKRALPLRPLLWPAAINTAAYTLLAFILLSTFAALRARLRRRRGQCAACGYAVGNLPKCPECGRVTATSPAPDPQSPVPSPAHPPASAP
jgi:hypothetical protein